MNRMREKVREKKQFVERASYTWSEDSLRLIMTPSNLAKQIYFYVQEAGYFKTAYPYFTERKNLNSFLLVYTLSGKGVLEYEEERLVITKGKGFLIDCEQPHHYYTMKNTEWEFLWVHFNGPVARGYYEEFRKNAPNSVMIENIEGIEGTIKAVLNLNQKKNRNTELLTSNQITGLLTEVLMATGLNDEDRQAMPQYVKEMAGEIDKNFNQNMPLEYFEDKYHFNKYHLLKQFKKYIGVTITEYIIICRMSYSKELLKYSDLSVGEVALEIGITNTTHYINLFKKREGMTPLEYRKLWLGTGENVVFPRP